MQDEQQPGWVFKPGDQQEASPETAVSKEAPIAAAPTPQAVDAPMDTAAAPNLSRSGSPLVTWTASEYIANPKSPGWFGALGMASLLLAIIVFIVTRDLISSFVIVILGAILGIFAARQPHVLTYAVDNTGLHIGEKFYPYASFKSFYVMADQALSYISLLPLRRFMPPLTIHYDPADEDKIASTLAEYLPYENHKPDIVENISRRIRF